MRALHGFTSLESRFIDGWRTGRLHPAWLIAGAEGTGKAAFARQAAAFLLAEPAFEPAALLLEHKPSFAAHWHSLAMGRIAANTEANFLELTPPIDAKTGRARSEIGVDAVRQMIEFGHLTAQGGGWRVAVIDSVDYLNANAANALLKFLEEPPAQFMIFLISHAPAALPATLRSRVLTHRIASLDQDVAQNILSALAPQHSLEERLIALALTENSPGKALFLLETDGVKIYRQMIELLRHGAKFPARHVHAISDQAARGGDTQFRHFALVFRRFLEAMIEHKTTSRPSRLAAEEVQKLSAAADLRQILALHQLTVTNLQTVLTLNLDKKQAALNALIGLSQTVAVLEKPAPIF